MLHCHDDRLDAVLSAGVHDLFQHHDHALAALQAEPLLCRPLRGEELLQATEHNLLSREDCKVAGFITKLWKGCEKNLEEQDSNLHTFG